MKTIKKYIFPVLTLLPILVLFLTACSKDEKDGSEGSLDLGEGTLTVTGDVEGVFKGMADFEGKLASQTETWKISMHNYSPQTFSLTLLKMNDGIENPKPGTYTIGISTKADFSAAFTHIVDEDYVNAIEYSTFEDSNSRTLTIESVTEKTIKGKFEFTAHEYDDMLNPRGDVEIKGQFKANKRKY